MDFFEIVNHFFNRERVDVIQLERSERVDVIQLERSEREVIQNPLAPERGGGSRGAAAGASTDINCPPRSRSKRACETSKGHSHFDS